MKWFLNECCEPYQYDMERQEDDFPNDFHIVFDTKEQATAWADEHYPA